MREKAQWNESTVSLGMKAESGDEWWRRRMRPGIEPEDEEEDEEKGVRAMDFRRAWELSESLRALLALSETLRALQPPGELSADEAWTSVIKSCVYSYFFTMDSSANFPLFSKLIVSKYHYSLKTDIVLVQASVHVFFCTNFSGIFHYLFFSYYVSLSFFLYFPFFLLPVLSVCLQM